MNGNCKDCLQNQDCEWSCWINKNINEQEISIGRCFDVVEAFTFSANILNERTKKYEP